MKYVIDEDTLEKDPRTKLAYRVYNKLVDSDLSNEDVIEVFALTLCLFALTNRVGELKKNSSVNKTFTVFLGHCSRLIPTMSFKAIYEPTKRK